MSDSIASSFTGEHDGVLLTDGELWIVRVNPAALRLLGSASEADVLGRSVIEFILATDLGIAIEAAHAIRRGDPYGAFIIKARRRDGRSQSIECGISAVLDEHGAFDGLLVIFHEHVDDEATTAHGSVSRPDRAAEHAPANDDPTIDTYHATIAHEFNNLLTLVRGHLDLARHGVERHSAVAIDLAEADTAVHAAILLTRRLAAGPRSPLARDSAAAVAEAVVPQHARGTETILVCDDDASLRALIAAGLRAYGYQVLEARDPSGALAVADAHDGVIHLLITDIMLPEMSGKGLAAAFLAIRPNVPVLFISGLSTDAIARSGERLAATPLLAKPFSASTLAGHVRQLLNGAAARTD